MCAHPYVYGEQQIEDVFILNSSPVVRECYAFEYTEGDDKGFWLGGKVRAIDRSGNIGNWGEPFLAYIPGPSRVNEKDASGYNSARRFFRSSEGILYLAYTNNNQIYFRYNDNRGWSSPQVVGEGKYPAMALQSDNKTASLVWSFNNYDNEYLLYSEMDPVTKTWSEPQAIFNTSNTSYVGVGAPSFAIHDDVAYIVFETALVGGRSETPLIINGFALLYIKFPLTDPDAYELVQLDSISFTRVYSNLDDLYDDLGGTSIDNAQGGPYILWDCDGSEMRFYQPAENPADGWLTEVFVGDTGPVYDPHVSVDGNQVYLFWAEGNPGEIYYRYLFAGDKEFISRPLRISNTSNDSRNPFYCKKYVFWSESVDYDGENVYDIVYRSLAENLNESQGYTNWSESANAQSRFPQVLYYESGGQIYRVGHYLGLWTEEDWIDRDDEFGLIMKEWTTDVIPKAIYTLGDTLPIPNTESRSGIVEYSELKARSADIDPIFLKYRLDGFDPSKVSWLGFYVYHEESQEITEKILIDGEPAKIEVIQSGVDTYFEVPIPVSAIEDSEVVVEIRELSGGLAILNEIYVFEVEASGGGPLSSMTGKAIPSTFGLLPPTPNPALGKTEIVLAIPERSWVTLKLYDVTGRLVNTCFSGMLNPGYHRVKIIPKDSYNRKLPQGVYFLRMEAGKFKRNRKLVLLK